MSLILKDKIKYEKKIKKLNNKLRYYNNKI